MKIIAENKKEFDMLEMAYNKLPKKIKDDIQNIEYDLGIIIFTMYKQKMNMNMNKIRVVFPTNPKEIIYRTEEISVRYDTYLIKCPVNVNYRFQDIFVEFVI